MEAENTMTEPQAKKHLESLEAGKGMEKILSRVFRGSTAL